LGTDWHSVTNRTVLYEKAVCISVISFSCCYCCLNDAFLKLLLLSFDKQNKEEIKKKRKKEINE
jgi:hypothetical protein